MHLVQYSTKCYFPTKKILNPATSQEAMQGMSMVGRLWIEIRVLLKQILISEPNKLYPSLADGKKKSILTSVLNSSKCMQLNLSPKY